MTYASPPSHKAGSPRGEAPMPDCLWSETPASKGRQSSRQSRDAGLPSVLRNPTSLLASQRESGFSSPHAKYIVFYKSS